MCSGVIVITSTITTWPITSATIAAKTRGRAMISPTEAPLPAASARVEGAKLAGSGRNVRSVSSAAAATKRIGTP